MAFGGLAVLSLLLCILYAWCAFGWYHLWAEGQVSAIHGKDEIIHDPYSLSPNPRNA
jgi:hypothetical protein